MEPLTFEEIETTIEALDNNPKICEKCKGRKFGWDDMGLLLNCGDCHGTGFQTIFRENCPNEKVYTSPRLC